MDIQSIAQAEQTVIAATIQMVSVLYNVTPGDLSGLPYQAYRIGSSGGALFRSADRFLPDGNIDNVNGGYWGNSNGGPSGGLTVVTSVAALAGTATSVGTVLLSALEMSGQFIWDSANLATQVSNDPGMGIYVPPNSDTSGASGAWVRQAAGTGPYYLAWWGIVGDGEITTATGVMTFPDNPSNGQTLSCVTPGESPTTITFVTGSPTGYEVQIGASNLATVANLLAFLQTTQDYTNISTCSYSGQPAVGLTGENGGVLSNNNLTLTSTTTSNYGGMAFSSNENTTGNFHVEFTLSAASPTIGIGFATNGNQTPIWPGFAGNLEGFSLLFSNQTPGWYVSGSFVSFPGIVWNIGDTWVFEINLGSQLVWGKNITSGNHYWNGSSTANPATSAGGVSFSSLPAGASYSVAVLAGYGTPYPAITVNFGATTFASTPSSGFVAWLSVTASQINVTCLLGGPSGNGVEWTTNVTGASVPANLSGGTVTGTDNTDAMCNYAYWARWAAITYGGHDAIAAANKILYNSLDNFFTFSDFGAWTLEGNNTWFVDTSSQGNPMPQVWNNANPDYYIGDYIENTTPGQFSVVLMANANAVNNGMVSGIFGYAIGDRVRVESLDGLGFGFPGTALQTEWHNITAIDSGNGTVYLDTPIEFYHRQDFADNPYPGQSNVGNATVGRARIWNSKAPGSWPTNSIGGGVNGTTRWDTTNYTLKGIAAQVGPNAPLQNILNENTGNVLIGRQFRTEDCNWVGITESVVEQSSHINLIAGNVIVDKQDGTSYYEMLQCSGQVIYTCGGKNVSYSGGRVDNDFSTGCANIVISNMVMHSFEYGLYYGSFGLSPGALVQNCKIANDSIVNSGAPTVLDGSTQPTWSPISGATGVTFGAASFTANFGASYSFPGGVFKLNTADNYPIQGYLPGTTFNFAFSNGGFFSGDLGSGFITGIFQDDTYTYITTSRTDLTALPSWANSNVYFMVVSQTEMAQCTGSDKPRAASDANKQGYRDFEYLRTFLYTGGVAGGNGYYYSSGPQGYLLEVDIDIIIPSSTSGDTVTFGINVFDGTNDFNYYMSGGSPVNLLITINANIAGLRTITLTGITGAQSGDSFDLGSAITEIPALMCTGSGNHQTVMNTSGTFTGMATVAFRTNAGIARTIPTVQFDSGSALQAYSQGGLP